MQINLIFTNKGKVAIENFNNEELIEIFTRYSNTLTKKYDIEIIVPAEANSNITEEGVLTVVAQQVNCDVETFFKELGRDIKVPLKKRLGTKLDTVFKIKIVE